MIALCKHYRDRGEQHPRQHVCRCEAVAGERCQPAYDGTMQNCPSFKQVERRTEPKPKITLSSTPSCVHLGVPTGNTISCPTCKGNVQLKTFACAAFDVCTLGESGKPIAGCKGCQQFTTLPPLVPSRIVKVNMPSVERPDGHGEHYNCSIIEWQGKTLLASRLGWAGSSVWLCELDGNYQPIRGALRDLRIQHPRALRGVEDPRLFVFNGSLHVAITGYDTATNGGTSQFVARLNDRLEADDVIAPNYEKRRSWEKNWGFFEHAGSLHCVYSISPHVVLKMDGEDATETSRLLHDFKWANTELRGGASPVRVGGEWYSWFHSFSKDTKGITHWGLGLYTFAAANPFQPLRHISHVILEANDTPKWSAKNILYPCGAMLRDGKWVVSYGQQDRECRVAFFDQAEVEKRLK